MAELQEEKPEFVTDAEARQSNLLFPDLLRNFLQHNYFAWNGSPNNTLVKRIGLVLLSLIPFTYSLSVLYTLVPPSADHVPVAEFVVGVIFGLPFTLITARLLRNAFRRNREIE